MLTAIAVIARVHPKKQSNSADLGVGTRQLPPQMSGTKGKRARFADDGTMLAVKPKKRKKRKTKPSAAAIARSPDAPVDLFIGNLPREATEDDVHSFIAQRIADESVTFTVRLATKKNGVSKCMAFVTLPNGKSATTVRMLNGAVFPSEVDGAKPRRMRVQETKSSAPKAPRVLTPKETAVAAAKAKEEKKAVGDKWTVVVGNLPYQAERAEVHAFFTKELGEAPTLTKLLKRRGVSRGVAMVSFGTIEVLRRAILLNQAEFTCAAVANVRNLNVEVANKTQM